MGEKNHTQSKTKIKPNNNNNKQNKYNLKSIIFLYEELSRFIQTVLCATFLHANKTTKDCTQFLVY